jgi:hypothetical protein
VPAHVGDKGLLLMRVDVGRAQRKPDQHGH